MTNLTRRAVLGGLAATTLPWSAQAARARAASPPNILWIITDDQPRRTLGRMRQVRRRLVQRGQRFPMGYSAVPWCGPARASILTSMYVHNHDCINNLTHRRFVDQGLDNDTVGTRMKAAGYDTGYFGKYMNGMLGTVEDMEYVAPGWDRWVNRLIVQDFCVDGEIRTVTGEYDAYAARQCAAFIRNRPHRPWFAVFAPVAPHSPYDPTRGHLDDYDGVKWDPPAFNEIVMRDKPSWMRVREDDPDGLPFKKRYSMQRQYEGKLEELQDVDDWIASLLDALFHSGQHENTYVFLLSDNGHLLGEHRLAGKEYAYEESSGLPFVVRGPGVAPGVPTQMVSQVDLMPTALDIAGVDPDQGRDLDGRSMLRGLHGDWSGWRQRLLVENAAESYAGGWAMLREGSVAYIDHYRRQEEEYYDLAEDPYQLESDPSRVTPYLRGALETLRHSRGRLLRAAEE